MNKKFITLVVLSLLVAAPAFAGGSTTYHGKVTVTSSGNGTVYLSDSDNDSNPPTWKSTSEKTISTVDNKAQTFYLYIGRSIKRVRCKQ